MNCTLKVGQFNNREHCQAFRPAFGILPDSGRLISPISAISLLYISDTVDKYLFSPDIWNSITSVAKLNFGLFA